MSVVDLLECGALDRSSLTDPEDRYRTLVHSGQRVGPFQWSLSLGDEGRALYDDDAPASLDDMLSLQPGIVRVSWEDREVFLVGAPTCVRAGSAPRWCGPWTTHGVRLPARGVAGRCRRSPDEGQPSRCSGSRKPVFLARMPRLVIQVNTHSTMPTAEQAGGDPVLDPVLGVARPGAGEERAGDGADHRDRRRRLEEWA